VCTKSGATRFGPMWSGRQPTRRSGADLREEDRVTKPCRLFVSPLVPRSASARLLVKRRISGGGTEPTQARCQTCNALPRLAHPCTGRSVPLLSVSMAGTDGRSSRFSSRLKEALTVSSSSGIVSSPDPSVGVPLLIGWNLTNISLGWLGVGTMHVFHSN